MFNQTSPLSYDLNQEYRQRQMVTVSHDIVTAKENNLMNAITNKNTIVTIVVAIVAFAMFFGIGSQPASAQEFDAGKSGPKSDSNSVHLILRSFVVAFIGEDYEMASLYADESIAANPNFAPGYTGRSALALLDGDFEAALIDAQEAVEIFPEDPASQFVLAQAHFALENYEEAHATYVLYLEMTEEKGSEAVLIRMLFGENISLEIAEANIDACNNMLED